MKKIFLLLLAVASARAQTIPLGSTASVQPIAPPVNSGAAPTFTTNSIAFAGGSTITDNGSGALSLLPKSGQAFTVNGLTVTASTGTLTVSNGKTASFSNTLTFTGTDSSSIAFGAGGTIGAVGYSSTGQVAATATNDDAATGKVGEFLSQTVAFASRISLSSNTPANIASLSLTAGDWDVSGVVVASMTSATSTSLTLGIGTASATVGPIGTYTQLNPATTTASYQYFYPTPTVRVSISSTSTVYLVVNVIFSAGTIDGFGYIRARRVR